MTLPRTYKPLFGIYDEETSAGIDLNRTLITHPIATFFIKISSVHRNPFGILSGDIAIVDKSLKPMKNQPILIFSHGKFLIKEYEEIRKVHCVIWGVITFVIHPTMTKIPTRISIGA